MGQLQPVARLPHFRNSNPLLPALQILNVDGLVGLKCLLCHWLLP